MKVSSVPAEAVFLLLEQWIIRQGKKNAKEKYRKIPFNRAHMFIQAAKTPTTD